MLIWLCDEAVVFDSENLKPYPEGIFCERTFEYRKEIEVPH